MTVVAAIRIRSYSQLTEAIAARRRSLGLTQLDTDEKSGCQPGYQGKLEKSIRHFGPLSLPMVLAALDCDLLLAPRNAVTPTEPRPGSCGLVHHLNRGDPS
jgi:hypothetical protein